MMIKTIYINSIYARRAERHGGQGDHFEPPVPRGLHLSLAFRPSSVDKVRRRAAGRTAEGALRTEGSRRVLSF